MAELQAQKAAEEKAAAEKEKSMAEWLKKLVSKTMPSVCLPRSELELLVKRMWSNKC